MPHTLHTDHSSLGVPKLANPPILMQSSNFNLLCVIYMIYLFNEKGKGNPLVTWSLLTSRYRQLIHCIPLLSSQISVNHMTLWSLC